MGGVDLEAQILQYWKGSWVVFKGASELWLPTTSFQTRAGESEPEYGANFTGEKLRR